MISHFLFSPDVISYFIFSPDVISYFLFSPDVISYFLFSPDVISYFLLSPHVISHFLFSPHVISYFIFSPDVISYFLFSPDVITPNGLNVKRMSHEFQNLHQVPWVSRASMLILLTDYFLCYLLLLKKNVYRAGGWGSFFWPYSSKHACLLIIKYFNIIGKFKYIMKKRKWKRKISFLINMLIKVISITLGWVGN